MGYLSKLTLTFKNVWVDVSVWAEVWFGQFFFHSNLPIPRRDADLKWNKKNTKHTLAKLSYCLIGITKHPFTASLSERLHPTLINIVGDHVMKAISPNSNA